MKAWACAVVVLVAALLGGCDGSSAAPEPTETFTPSESTDTPTATESSDPGPVEPTLPQAAKQATREGAEAFVRYYWELVNYAQQTGDTSGLRAIQGDGCDACTSGADWIDSVYKAGGQIHGGQHTVEEMSATHAPVDFKAWLVRCSLLATKTTVSGAGKLNETIGQGRFTTQFSVIFQRGRWEVSSWQDI